MYFGAYDGLTKKHVMRSDVVQTITVRVLMTQWYLFNDFLQESKYIESIDPWATIDDENIN